MVVITKEWIEVYKDIVTILFVKYFDMKPEEMNIHLFSAVNECWLYKIMTRRWYDKETKAKVHQGCCIFGPKKEEPLVFFPNELLQETCCQYHFDNFAKLKEMFGYMDTQIMAYYLVELHELMYDSLITTSSIFHVADYTTCKKTT